MPTAADYYLAIAGMTGADNAGVLERGRRAGRRWATTLPGSSVRSPRG